MALIGSIQVTSGEHFHFIKVNLSENILVTKSRFIGINSTMVRLKLNKHYALNTKYEVSIPQWFD